MRNYSFLFFESFIISDFMNGEIDLELYTISMIRLNNALEKLETSQDNDDIKEMFKESCRDFEELYKDIISDLNGEEIQFNDYYLFFENGKQVFPQYIDALKKIENEEIKEYIDSLINVFANLNKISKSFPSQQDMVKWVLI